MNIQELAAEVKGRLFGAGDYEAIDVTHDSRNAREGTVFVAIKGQTVDGHRFIDDVVRRGAVAIISESDPPAGLESPWITVADARVALGLAASAVYGHPSRQLQLVGITGTNGKTTTTYLYYALAAAAGHSPAMLTTVEYRIGAESEEAIRTTPEASDTNKFLRRALAADCTTAVMEASSQAIDLHRCDGLAFHTAIFTNLTQDHLDHHGTMENYFDAKKKLFDGRLGTRPELSVVNLDDKWGVALADELRGNGQRVTTFSQKSDADLTATDIEVSMVRGTSYTLKTPIGTRSVRSPLVGRPHVYNMLAATAAAIELGADLDQIEAGLATCIGAPGRFEKVPHDGEYAVVVDYAHTDDALENTLKTARDLTDGRIITIFGCGGDRDRSKRAPMGRAAGIHSDVVIVTSDNPRNEDPLAIISEIEVGLSETGVSFEVISDRREAIYQGILAAKTGDVVIIAGKGHETYQLIGGDKFHFDDREAATEAIARRNESE